MATELFGDSEEQLLMDLTVMAAAGIAVTGAVAAKRLRKVRSMWVRPMFERRREVGAYNMLMMDLRQSSDATMFSGFTRISPDMFDSLLTAIEDLITGSKRFRMPIEPELKLAVTLRYLATGESFRSLSYHFRINNTSIGQVVQQVCEALYTRLQPKYLKVPSTANEWLEVASGFERWNFPMCIGAMDGKHILIRKPGNTGSTFFNYKRTFSIQLLAIVDADYKFLYVDVGSQGRIGDAGMYHNSSFRQALDHNGLNIPADRQLPGTDQFVPHVLVADEAFPLTRHIIKPFAHRGLNKEERIFNYRLSRARRIVENAFGILASRFRVFRAPMEIHPDKATKVVLAATVLHNYMRCHSNSNVSFITREDELQSHGTDKSCSTTGLRRLRPCLQNPSVSAKQVRSSFANYFMTSGQVSWQWDME